MTRPDEPTGDAKDAKGRLGERMGGDYEPPIVDEPTGGPVPDWDDDTDQQ
jgi:hypothetical protein